MRLPVLVLMLVLSACAFTATQSTQQLQSLPAGQWELEKPHGSVLFRIKHLGLSWYTARFADFDATLDFDPKSPAASHVKAIINPLSVHAQHPTDRDWDRRIGEDLLEGKAYPQIVFDSTRVETTGEFTGKVTGNLTMMGVTEPVTLDVTYNGGMDSAALYAGRPAVGFSARGLLDRTDFGLTRYSSIIGSEVEIVIEVEFTKRGQ
jgi:polyisoprenoid-binding protein YceI